jgi:hypothetical protein
VCEHFEENITQRSEEEAMEGKFVAPLYGVNEMASLEPAKLLDLLRMIVDISDRRSMTHQIHSLKLSDWKLNKSFDNTMAGFLVSGIHQPFRDSFDDVIRQSPTQTVNVKMFTSVNNSVHDHHNFEVASVFPILRQRDRKISRELDILEKDNTALVALERKIIAENDRAALIEFVAAFKDHLNREEMLIVPLLMDQSIVF